MKEIKFKSFHSFYHRVKITSDLLMYFMQRKNCGNASRDLYIYCADDQNIRFFLCDK